MQFSKLRAYSRQDKTQQLLGFIIQEITYLYDATGKKAQKIAPEYVGGIVGMQNQVTDYMQGGFQYKNNIQLLPIKDIFDN